MTVSPPPGVVEASTVPAGGDDDVLHDRQPEPGPARRAGAVGAVETLEEARQLVLGNAGAMVRDDQAPLAGRLGTGDRAGGRRSPAWRIAFSSRFSTTTWSIRARTGRSNEAVQSIRISRPAAGRGRRPPPPPGSITGSARIEPSATTARPLSSSLRNSTSSISSPIRSTSPRARPISSSWSAPGERALEEREQPGERRAQLVRDGRREAGAELLVGGEVAGGAQVHERLAAAVDVVGDLERVRPPRRRISSGSTDPSTTPSRDSRARRLAVSTRRNSSTMTTISRLSSIEDAARVGLDAERLGRRRGGRAAAERFHQIVTE